MKRPSFQFYPGDWQRNANLRRCSPAARGVWVDIMCLLHDSDEYGVLRWPLEDIAQAAGASMTHVRELVTKQVFKGVDAGECEAYVYIPRSGRRDGDPVTLIAAQAGPIWYSSRMVRDQYVRIHAGANTRFGAGTDTEKPSPNPSPPRRHGERQGERRGEDQGDGSSIASATAVNSVPNGTGAAAPAGPKDWMFSVGLSMLTEAGTPQGQARKVIGMWCRDHGDEATAKAMQLVAERRPADPIAAIQAQITGKPSKRSADLMKSWASQLTGGKPDEPEAIEGSAQRVG